MENGDIKATVKFMQSGISTYSLSNVDNPPATAFFNTSESQAQGHPMDMLYEKEDVFYLIKQFVELNEVCYESIRILSVTYTIWGFSTIKYRQTFCKKPLKKVICANEPYI